MAPAEGEQDGAAQQRTADELARLLTLVRDLREMIPHALDERLTDSVHELLLALRALIDWMLERQQHQTEQPAEMQDIPVL